MHVVQHSKGTRYVPSVFQILAASRDVTVFQLVFIPVPKSSPFCSASLSLRRSHISIPVSSEFPLPLGVVCPPPLPAPPLASDPFCPPNFPSALSQVTYWSCAGLVLVLCWSSWVARPPGSFLPVPSLFSSLLPTRWLPDSSLWALFYPVLVPGPVLVLVQLSSP